VISLGDCTVNGNVSAPRNPASLAATLERAYGKTIRQPELSRLIKKAPQRAPYSVK
jgi:coenzyme F420-reducing hydrogenase gamma subunit